MKILIVNDDAIDAPGIAVLAEAAMELGEVWVVAPARQCSAMSQKLTIHGDMRLEKVEDYPVAVKAAYKADGTPVDCVKIALRCILEDKPDYIFSGINNGYNAGFDIAYSGTLGAAFEAVRNGIPAMAFSTAGNQHLDIAKPYLADVIRELMETGLEQGEVWNVNFPAGEPKGILRDRIPAPTSMYLEEYVQTKLPDGSVMLEVRGKPVANELIPAGTDAEAVRSGYISIGRVKSSGF